MNWVITVTMVAIRMEGGELGHRCEMGVHTTGSESGMTVGTPIMPVG